MSEHSCFQIEQILKRVIEELEIKINAIMKPDPSKKARYDKKDFFISAEASKDFPVSRDTYYKYTACLKRQNHKYKNSKVRTMNMDLFYDICTYTDVSADYYLGFIKTKRKEASAKKVNEEFGLSDKSMQRLKSIKEYKAESLGEVTPDIVNFFLENDTFWNMLNGRLPAYLSCLYYRTDDINVDMARYGIVRAFEELLDELVNDLLSNIGKKEQPLAELDPTTAFPSLL